LKQIVAAHLAAFPGFFLTEMGGAFLAEYYQAILEYDRGLILVARRENQVAGFVAGYLNPDAFFCFLRRRWIRFVWPVVWGLVRGPRLLPRLLGNVKRTGRAWEGDATPQRELCELASLAVIPAQAGAGLGEALLHQFTGRVSRMGAVRLVLTTDARANEAVNRFYIRRGFKLVDRFQAPGNRLMNRYAKGIVDGGFSANQGDSGQGSGR